ncbi:response regulator [Pseudaminobacter sp. 19-2017]|uniref:histidine kinase n=1 Tax=Pseudaminobacter soli (ex Zhang et al. 2022) TaxID=2831468 RepID=A0A942I6P2_9HYPH|nr:hybrid sensor histidine kinase/response regulator [Pseudaminobacter soli]MBS3647510.1 response regulator [Pseudaminobacter soli]
MPVRDITDIERLRKINAALISRVERSMDQQANAFSLFQTAINLEGQVRSRTEELRSTLRRLEESNVDLLAAKEQAELANQSKTRFLAAASHDVLQPLNAAHLSISALADLQTTEEGRRLIGQVERSLTTISHLLLTLLDISKLDAGVVRPDISDVALDPLLSSIKSDFEPIAEQKGLKFQFRTSHAVVRSDETMLRRIVQNIVSNAVRYTSSGGVLVGARKRGTTIRIDVVDTGCGIPADQYEAIFDEFHRCSATPEHDVSGAGLGLGLSIVRRMADALGHRIGFTSVTGRGTVFRLEMPLATGPVAVRPKVVQPPRGYGLFGTRVLLIEDDRRVIEATTSLLSSWRCEVKQAGSLSEAIRCLRDTGWIPDVLIADQHLEGGDLGSQTIIEVRAYLGRAVPALIVTADHSPALSYSARASGIELMRKPVKPAELRALLAHLLA